MMVELHKLERIADVINQQANLLRSAGRIAQAMGMEERAAELRTLCEASLADKLIEFQRQAA